MQYGPGEGSTVHTTQLEIRQCNAAWDPAAHHCATPCNAIPGQAALCNTGPGSKAMHSATLHQAVQRSKGPGNTANPDQSRQAGKHPTGQGSTGPGSKPPAARCSEGPGAGPCSAPRQRASGARPGRAGRRWKAQRGARRPGAEGTVQCQAGEPRAAGKRAALCGAQRRSRSPGSPAQGPAGPGRAGHRRGRGGGRWGWPPGGSPPRADSPVSWRNWCMDCRSMM